MPDARHALQKLIKNGTTIRAAVAFVTESGVSELAAIIEERQDVTLEVVARAADATTPEALLALRDRLDANVAVVIGKHAQRFHPKLWMFETDGVLSVLSGSGNITVGGLITNQEQHDVVTMPAGSDEAVAHGDRFERLIVNALSLDEVMASAIWREWLNLIKAQARLKRQMRDLQKHLDAREPIADRTADKARLINELSRLYDETVAAKLSRPDGGYYVPSRFKQGIERARAGADPVLLVTRIVRKQSGGFDILLHENRPDLTVENLVVDDSMPFHDMLKGRTRELSVERLAQFPAP